MRDIMRNFYKNLFLEEIGELNEKKNLLLHSCCGPCSSYVIEYLSEWFNITVLYYNPNISPQEEYEKRKQEQIRFLKEYPSKNKLDIMDIDYDYNDFLSIAKELEQEKEGGRRCHKCYLLRLEKTAQIAKKHHFDYFGTSLTVSPYKNAQKLNEIGLELAKEYGVSYLVSDFKKEDGYRKSIMYSKEYQLYRQDYCGCIYSKKEREEKKHE